MKNRWDQYAFAAVNVGETQADEQTMREVDPDAPQGGELQGVAWQLKFQEMLQDPVFADKLAVVQSAIDQGGDPDQIARSTYYEAYYIAQRAKMLAQRMPGANPQQIAEALNNQELQGTMYANEEARLHEQAHLQGLSMTPQQAAQELANSLPSDTPEEIKQQLGNQFVNSWIQSMLDVGYAQGDINDEIGVAKPGDSSRETNQKFQEWAKGYLNDNQESFQEIEIEN